jgi:hypothetical protein
MNRVFPVASSRRESQGDGYSDGYNPVGLQKDRLGVSVNHFSRWPAEIGIGFSIAEYNFRASR